MSFKTNKNTFNLNKVSLLVRTCKSTTKTFTCKLFHPRFVLPDFHIYLKLNFLEDLDSLRVLVPSKLHLARATERKRPVFVVDTPWRNVRKFIGMITEILIEVLQCSGGSRISQNFQPLGGANLLSGQFFPENCMKMKTFCAKEGAFPCRLPIRQCNRYTGGSMRGGQPSHGRQCLTKCIAIVVHFKRIGRL